MVPPVFTRPPVSVLVGLLISAFFLNAAEAADGGDGLSGLLENRLSVTTGFLSHHTAQRHSADHRGWNENNTGIGFEYRLTGNLDLAAGVYKNSVYRTSHYLQLVYTPDFAKLHLGPVAIDAGLAVGAADGYPKRNHGRYAPAVLPVVSLTMPLPGGMVARSVGLNFTYVPSLTSAGTAGAFAVQAKLSF
jgi:hypothetical protein